MTNITEEVRRILANDIAIENCLALGIINMSGLAKFLIKKYNLNASIDSVISAIRRFDAKREYKLHKRKLKDLFIHSSIHTKSNLVAINVIGRRNVIACIGRISALVDMDGGDTLRMVQGEAFLKVIIDEENLSKIQDTLIANHNLSIDKDLVELTIATKKDFDLDHTKGVMARITNELAMSNINILEFVFSLNDIHVYVDKKDSMRAHGVLLALSEKE